MFAFGQCAARQSQKKKEAENEDQHKKTYTGIIYVLVLR